LKVLLCRWLFPVATGSLLVLSFPPFDSAQTAWLALIPLLFALEDCRPGEAFRRGYLAGLVFFGGTVWWVVHVSLPGMVALVAFLALYFGLAGMWVAWILRAGWWERRPRRDGGTGPVAAGTPLPPDISSTNLLHNLLFALLAATGWVTLEWMRGHFIFGGFPWNYLGASQYSVATLIQFTEYTGVHGVSAMVCAVNCLFFVTIRRFRDQVTRQVPLRRLSWEFYVAALLLCGTFMHGLRVIRDTPRGESTLRLGMVQANIPQTLKIDPNERPLILERYSKLTEAVIAGQPDLIIWPETATASAILHDKESIALINRILAASRVPLLTGSFDVRGGDAYNAAFLIEPEKGVQAIYRKIHLVPFGEYVPLRKIFPFLKWLTPIGDSLERGNEFTTFEVAGRRFAPVICFEDTVPEVYREFVKRDVDFMVNLTNDAWFKESPAATMHLANAVFRAVETRRPLVRCTNHGITCVVDEFGLVPTRLEPFTEGSLNCELRLPASRVQTFYVRHGDVFVAGCVVLSGVAFLFSHTRKSATVTGA